MRKDRKEGSHLQQAPGYLKKNEEEKRKIVERKGIHFGFTKVGLGGRFTFEMIAVAFREAFQSNTQTA